MLYARISRSRYVASFKRQRAKTDSRSKTTTVTCCLPDRAECNVDTMPQAVTRSRTAVPVIEIRRLDPCVTSKPLTYPGLAKGTRVLVTTGGPIADYVMAIAQSAGCAVTVLGSSPCSAHPASRGANASPREYIVVEGSMTSPESCAKAVIGQELVLHAAAAEASRNFLEGTKNLLSAAAAAGVKGFVLASSAR